MYQARDLLAADDTGLSGERSVQCKVDWVVQC